MIPILLSILGCAVVFWVITWFVTRDDYFDWGDRASAFVSAFLLASLVGGIGGGIYSMAKGASLPHKQVVTARYQLVSLHDAAGIEGNFFLASGRIDSVVKIHYVESTPDGLQFHSMDEEDSSVYVVQEARSDGELDVVENLFQNPDDGNWAINSLHWTKYIFHVPLGSVTTCFELDQAGANVACKSS